MQQSQTGLQIGENNQIDSVTVTNTFSITSTKSSKSKEPPKIIFNVPSANPNFTGRDGFLTILHNKLIDNDLPKPHLIVIKGRSGVGKTTTVSEFVWRNVDSFKGIAWFNLQTKGDITYEHQRFLKKINITLGPGQFAKETNTRCYSEFTKQVYEWLGKNSGWLIVYDNVEHIEQFNYINSTSLKGSYILVITKNDLSLKPVVILNELKENEGINLFDKILNSSDKNMNCRGEYPKSFFTGLPLTLTIAAAFIKQNIKPSKFSDWIKENDLAKVDDLENYFFQQLSSFWAITSPELQLNTKQLIEKLSFMGPTNIPYYVYEKMTDDDDDTFRCLRDLSLISYNKEEETFSMHELFQQVVREGCNVDAIENMAKVLKNADDDSVNKEKDEDWAYIKISNWCFLYLYETFIKTNNHFKEESDLKRIVKCASIMSPIFNRYGYVTLGVLKEFSNKRQLILKN